MKLERIYQVKKCVRSCYFYSHTIDGMECNHPFFDNKDWSERLIITHDVIIPEKCPLRTGGVEIINKIQLVI